ncbi:MAG: hypothetical protein A3E36_00735 [Candidatus Andersenbacteria bacterium RIFCSPHIGHO2_12_FULL_45_11b]|uniref:Glutamate racemase n=1 Tax=Candidatus Andersenbacteria bacterium RIFCSPHIGHO2_12_FULL_45_11b TaxID=1797282 RepID=A0A1G1X783_9BACT|nr:MAG: hypothetical protein A3E36_00735 [Candidatus Andersenbacteria bacterium RIFCSPHIGHO2_12_FULL_45_11b]
MIGVFDSGYGGLAILRALRSRLPDYSYAYLGDNAHAPYGPKPDEEIFELTKQGVEQLFQKGCNLVILGCNTASASALRRLQQEWMSITHPAKKILGIIVPTAEAVSGHHFETIGILATQHTVSTGAYEKEIHKLNPEIKIIQQPCNNLAGIIEQYGADDERVVEEVKVCIKTLCTRSTPPSLPLVRAGDDASPPYEGGARGGFVDAILLACTHYEFVADTIQRLLPKRTILIRQPEIVAQSLESYLDRHPEIEKKLNKKTGCQYFTTGNQQDVSAKSSSLMQEEVVFTAL